MGKCGTSAQTEEVVIAGNTQHLKWPSTRKLLNVLGLSRVCVANAKLDVKASMSAYYIQ